MIDSKLASCFGLKLENSSNLIQLSCFNQFRQTKPANDSAVQPKENNNDTNNAVPLAQSSSRKVTLPLRKSLRKRKSPISEKNEENSEEVDFIFENDNNDNDYEVTTEKPKKRSRSAAKTGSLQLNAVNADEQSLKSRQDKLDALFEEQLNNLTQLLPFNWTLSDPSLFSNVNEYQNLLLSCQDAGTVIHACSGSPFDFKKEFHDMSKLTLYTYPNKIEKLIVLPSTSICAIVAVGIRNGMNIIQPVALKGWPMKANFENLLEMLLNVSGTSKVKFFNHDRYYKFKKIAAKPNRIGR